VTEHCRIWQANPVTSIAPALIGFGGVVIGAAMTTAAAWWQTMTTRKSRLAELELNFQHERFLRDEAAKRSALLEIYYVLKSFERKTYELYSEHRHGTGYAPWSDESCGNVDITKVAKCFNQYREGVDKHSALLGEALNLDFEKVVDFWEQVISEGQHLDHRQYDYDYGNEYPVYCDVGYDFCLIHQEIENAERSVRREVEKLSSASPSNLD
jgi:hypothetical protein